MLNSIIPWTLLMSRIPSPSSSSFTTSRKWRWRRSTSEITSRYVLFIRASSLGSLGQISLGLVNYSSNFTVRFGDKAIYRREIEATYPLIDKQLIERRRRGPHRRRRCGGAGRLLRQPQILQHHRRGEAC